MTWSVNSLRATMRQPPRNRRRPRSAAASSTTTLGRRRVGRHRRRRHRSVASEVAVVDRVEVGAVAAQVGEAAAGGEDGVDAARRGRRGSAATAQRPSSRRTLVTPGDARARRAGRRCPVTPTVNGDAVVEVGGQLVDRADATRRPLHEDPDAVAHLLDLVQQVRRQQHGHALVGAQPLDEQQQLADALRGRCSPSARRGSGSTGPSPARRPDRGAGACRARSRRPRGRRRRLSPTSSSRPSMRSSASLRGSRLSSAV